MDLLLEKDITSFLERAQDAKASKPSQKYLTKSKFLSGIQCQKLLWIKCNQPDLMPDAPDFLQQIFNSGIEIGQLATSYFPDGKYIQEEDFVANIKETKELIDSRWDKPIYEAGIVAGRLYARADILKPVGDGTWDIIEVKSSTKVKDVNEWDLAFQKYCYEQAGLTINRCYLMHINNEYIKDGPVDVQEFFICEDITEEIKDHFKKVPDHVESFLKTMDRADIINEKIGKHCNKPYVCLLKEHCQSFLPKESVIELYKDNKGRGFDFIDQGILALEDIPDDFDDLTERHQVQYAVAKNKKTYINQDAIEAFLDTLIYPLYYVDFETICEALPRFDGSWAYQQVPFQYSLHIQHEKGAPLEHVSFLHTSQDSPCEPFLKSLRTNLGNQGSIIVYNRTFEESLVLKKLVNHYPDYAPWVDEVCDRMVDLLVPFSKFDYYHKNQKGSASIKKVHPVLMGYDGYKDMDIADGAQASMAYARVTYGNNIDATEKQKVYQDLEKYCTLDTYAMVEILEKLIIKCKK